MALPSVFESLKNLDNRVLAKYAASFTGNPDFKDHVKNGCFKIVLRSIRM